MLLALSQTLLCRGLSAFRSVSMRRRARRLGRWTLPRSEIFSYGELGIPTRWAGGYGTMNQIVDSEHNCEGREEPAAAERAGSCCLLRDSFIIEHVLAHK